MILRLRYVAAVAAVSLSAEPLWGCPLCESSTGQQVRAGIFNADFGSHLVSLLLPFPVLVGIVALIYFGLPPWRKAEPVRVETKIDRRADQPPREERHQ